MKKARSTEIEIIKTTGSAGIAPYVLDKGTRERLSRIIDDGTPPNTKRAYESDMRYFWSWCSAIGWSDEPVLPVPPEIVAKFIADHLEGLDPEIDADLIARGAKTRTGPHSISTIDRRVSTLSSYHKAKGAPSPGNSPTVSKLMSKARKAAARRGVRPNKKKAVVRETLDLLLDTCSGDTIIDRRDRALLLFGWASGGRRRSEIVGTTIDRLEERGDDFVYHLGVTKSDQEGEGNTVPVAGRAAQALRDWLAIAEINEGAIFRSVDRHSNIAASAMTDRSVALIIKHRVKLAGLPPSVYSGHSLRSGFLTETGIQGKNLLEAMKLSGHKTMQVAAGYHQAGAALLNETANLAG